MPAATPDSVDAYIAMADAAARPVLAALRAIILDAAPGVEERISWGVPFYRLGCAPLAGIAVYRAHVSFGTGGASLGDAMRAALKAKGYKTGEKTLQIRFDQPVPEAQVRAILNTGIQR